MGGTPTGLSRRACAWILVAAGLLTVSVLGAVIGFNSPPEVFTRPASADTYVSSFAPATPRGAAPVLWVSRGGGNENWSLIQFDLFGKLRPGDLVVKARIRLTIADASVANWPVAVLAPRTITAWQENSTTFSTAPNLGFDTSTTTWVGVGTPAGLGAVVWIDVTKQLRRWQSYGGPSNFGTALTMGTNISNAAIGFASRENQQLGNPLIEVTFQPGPRAVYGYVVSLQAVAVGAREE